MRYFIGFLLALGLMQAQVNLPTPVRVLPKADGSAAGELVLGNAVRTVVCTAANYATCKPLIIQNGTISGANLAASLNITGATGTDGRIIITPGNVAAKASTVLQAVRAGEPALILQDSGTGGTSQGLTLENSAGTDWFTLTSNGGVAEFRALNGANFDFVASNGFGGAMGLVNSGGTIGLVTESIMPYTATTDTIGGALSRWGGMYSTLFNGSSLVLTPTGLSSNDTTIMAHATPSSAWTWRFPIGPGTSGYVLSTDGSGNTSWISPSGTGTVTSVGWAGGLVTVANPTTTPAFTVAGTSGGVPYFSSASTWASSAALTANLPVIGGGAGAAPSVGTRSGNTTAFVTTTGTQTSGNCVSIDASGNHIASGAACAAAGANTSLSNLSSVAINASLGMGSNNAYSIGSLTAQLANSYVYNTAQASKVRVAYMSGTTLTDYFDFLAGSGQLTLTDSSSNVLFQYQSGGGGGWGWRGVMYPGTNATYDLGTTSYNWKDAFLSGSLTLGASGSLLQGANTLADGSGNIIARAGFYVNNGTTYTGQTHTYTMDIGAGTCTIITQGGIVVGGTC